MRTLYRVLFSILTPLLFVALLAVVFSFDLTIVQETSKTTTDLDAGVSIMMNINLDFSMANPLLLLEHFHIFLQEAATAVVEVSTFISGTSVSVSINPSIVVSDLIEEFTAPNITFSLLSLIGVGSMLVGLFICLCGGDSKVFTSIGAIIAIGGSVCLFINPAFKQGMYYKGTMIATGWDGTTTTKTIMDFSLPWLSAYLAAGVLDGLVLLEAIVVLTRKNRVTAEP